MIQAHLLTDNTIIFSRRAYKAYVGFADHTIQFYPSERLRRLRRFRESQGWGGAEQAPQRTLRDAGNAFCELEGGIQKVLKGDCDQEVTRYSNDCETVNDNVILYQ